MAWALQFDGVDDYATFTTISLSSDFDIEFTFLLDSGAGSTIYVIETQASGGQWIGRWNGNHIVYWGGSINTVSACAVDTEYKYRLVRTGTSVDWYINDVLENTFTNANTLHLYRFSRSGGNRMNGRIGYLNVIDNGTQIHYFDPDVSDHSNTGQQPVLVDTVGSNDATGVNMPTDGSAWVDLGGGSVTGTINLTLDNTTISSVGQVGSDVSGTINITLSDVTQNASGQVGNDVSGSISITLDDSQALISGQVGSDISGVISITLSDDLSSSAGQVGSGVSGSMLYTNISDTMTAAGTVAISVSGSINYTLEDDFMIASGIGGDDESMFTAINLKPIQLTQIQLKQIVLITN